MAQGEVIAAYPRSLKIWRSYQGRADCENRIKELKYDFGLNSFYNSFYATEEALGFAMMAYNLMRTFRQAMMRAKIQTTLSTLHQQVLAVGAFWNRDPNQINYYSPFHDNEGRGLRVCGRMPSIRLCCRFRQKSSNGLSGLKLTVTPQLDRFTLPINLLGGSKNSKS